MKSITNSIYHENYFQLMINYSFPLINILIIINDQPIEICISIILCQHCQLKISTNYRLSSKDQHEYDSQLDKNDDISESVPTQTTMERYIKRFICCQITYFQQSIFILNKRETICLTIRHRIWHLISIFNRHTFLFIKIDCNPLFLPIISVIKSIVIQC